MPLHSLRRLARRLFRPTRPIRLSTSGRNTRGAKPRLEVLEDRTVLSTVNWVGGSGDWSNASNWLDAVTQAHHVPTPTDDAVINMAGDITVTHSAGSDRVHSLVSQNAFVMSGGSLDLNADSALEGAFTFTNGILSGRGNLTVDSPFTWTGGTMSGLGHTVVTGTLALSNLGGFNPSTTLDGRALDNYGTTTWTGVGNISVGNGGSFNTVADAVFIVSTDTVSGANFTGFGTPGAFNNQGTFVKQNTSGTASFGVAFNNGGTVDVMTGALNLNNGGNSTGAFAAEAGATLAFNQGTHTLRAASSVIGDGTVQLGMTGFNGGGTVNVLGVYSVNTTNLVSSAVNFAHDSTLPNLNMSGGTLTGLNNVTVTGTLNWTGGTMTGAGRTVSTGALNIGGSGAKSLDMRTLTNAGTATWTGTDIQVSNQAVFNNLSGGQLRRANGRRLRVRFQCLRHVQQRRRLHQVPEQRPDDHQHCVQQQRDGGSAERHPAVEHRHQQRLVHGGRGHDVDLQREPHSDPGLERRRSRKSSVRGGNHERPRLLRAGGHRHGQRRHRQLQRQRGPGGAHLHVRGDHGHRRRDRGGHVQLDRRHHERRGEHRVQRHPEREQRGLLRGARVGRQDPGQHRHGCLYRHGRPRHRQRRRHQQSGHLPRPGQRQARRLGGGRVQQLR
jgi:hypothetical protein